MIRYCLTAITFAAAMLCWQVASARTLIVGPDQALTQPSQAAARARDGDIIRIEPGTYHDCAIWRASHLLIEGTSPETRLSRKTCAGKGIFVIEGNDITIRGITFADASVIWHNGAGIRVAGDNLTVENSIFLHNENGILAGGSRNSALRIRNSVFIGNGACTGACAHGVYAGGPIRLLDIEHCVFRDTKIAHHIKSRAQNTIVRGSVIEDGPRGTASYLIDVPNGGNVLIAGNAMEKGPRSSNPGVAISIGEEGVTNPTRNITIRGNAFRNDAPGRTTFVRNDTAASVVLSANAITGNVRLLSTAPPKQP